MFRHETRDWPQAAGPNGNWQSDGRAPVRWSAARGENVLWRTALPEEGQSGIAVAGDRLYFTTMKPMSPDNTKREGGAVVGYAADARTGKLLWSVELPADEPSPYAYGFSDSSSPTPIASERGVWFVNASGLVVSCDHGGKILWRRDFKPTVNRPFNKQFEPILSGDILLNVEPRAVGDPRREADPWNYLHGIDSRTGKTVFVSDDALTHYTTPVAGHTADNRPAVLIGRGGYHDVPEAPSGLSLVSLAKNSAGRTLWRTPLPGKALYNLHWDKNFAYWFDLDASTHTVLDSRTGKILRTQPLGERADVRRWDAHLGRHVLAASVNLAASKTRVFPAWFTNIVVGGWHWFLCFTDTDQGFGPAHCVGRIRVDSGRVEFLELPTAPGIRGSGAESDASWGTTVTASTVNSRGLDVAQDPRSRRDGWFWCFLGSPVAVGGVIYWTNMAGITYAIDGRARTLDASAIRGVSDLGPIGNTWSLNSVAYTRGRLYHRSLTELFALGR